jgi:hypothetical protein
VEKRVAPGNGPNGFEEEQVDAMMLPDMYQFVLQDRLSLGGIQPDAVVPE